MESEIKGLAKGLIEEIIKADMTMHASQVEAWAWMSKHRPNGDLIPEDIFKGFPESRYLSLNEVNCQFHIKPLPVQSFRTRFKLGMKLILGRSTSRSTGPHLFDFCGSSDENAQHFNITVKRLENGKIEADYFPADTRTSEILQE
jgi:hypothetical protein